MKKEKKPFQMIATEPKRRRRSSASYALLCFLLLCSLFSFNATDAVEKPTSEDARKFLEYYFQGENQGAVLAEIKFCQDIIKRGNYDDRCDGTLSQLKVGESGYIWLTLVVPKGNEKNIMLEFEQDGITQATQAVHAKESMRYYFYSQFTAQEVGKVTAKVFQPRGKFRENLGEFSINVVDDGQDKP